MIELSSVMKTIKELRQAGAVVNKDTYAIFINSNEPIESGVDFPVIIVNHPFVKNGTAYIIRTIPQGLKVSTENISPAIFIKNIKIT